MIALAGTLNLQTGVLTLLNLTSGSTAPNATYVQSTAGPNVFKKVGTV